MSELKDVDVVLLGQQNRWPPVVRYSQRLEKSGAHSLYDQFVEVLGSF